MFKKIKYLSLPLLLIGVISCKKPFQPAIISSANNYLVVEGLINSGSDSTFIKLSRTVKLSDSVRTNIEKGATVTVEGAGFSRSLNEITPGVYATAAMNLNPANKYHLLLKLSNGQQYVSDDAEVKISPPVDTISYTKNSEGIQINASSHDPGNNTRYYRYDYDETWKFHAKYLVEYEAVGDDIVPRPIENQIYICFGHRASSVVLLASTVKLANDVASNIPITQILSSSEKISMRYSILVRQYALTREAYEFWENLKKNTEQLGSIFDALPSELKGNIHNVANAGEPVIGYISVGTVQTKRLFIDRDELPDSYLLKYPYEGCTQDTTLFYNPQTRVEEVKEYLLTKLFLPTFSIPGPRAIPIGYGRTSYECGDCTIRGTKKQPAFWKDK
ncbi:hypothetical protein A0256_14775 [Mucilaginibacter sp. PAMC 26640]|nr:hypothetical protein A0256_14775 [Mucilaginibacter sp. PAMC 26640]